MEIKNFIKIYDNILPLVTLSNLIRYSNNSSFEESKINGGDNAITDFNIRRTYVHGLNNTDENNLSKAHWFNLLYKFLSNYIHKYGEDSKILHFSCGNIFDISILKYENTGFYTWHVDHFSSIPRTMSCIFLLNNDYEGGNLCFRNPDGSGEWEVEVKPNRLILWPSNFLYPHTVKPVTKGKRYSVVAWAL